MLWRARQILAMVLALAFLSSALPVRAQGFDPRPVLGQLITAFQNCGPPAVYQMLSPQLFLTIAQQTGGQGCYQQIRAAGPIQNMQILDQRQFPIGPLY